MTSTKFKFNQFKYSVAISSALIFSSVAVDAAQTVPDYSLEQVVIFSRHGLRAPMATPSSALGKVTPNQWPTWDTPASYLTVRGGALESYFGHYLKEWFVDNQLLADNACPTSDDIRIYANSIQRTIATGQYIAIGAFPGCEVPVYHKYKMNTMDELFSLNIRDGSPEFKKQATDSIIAQAGAGGLEGLNTRLKPVYLDMSEVIDYPNSANCKTDKQCDFLDQAVSVKIVKGQEPGVTGPLRMGTSIADAFILQYYEGSPMNEIAWGKIKSQEQFEQLVSIKENYNTTVFSAPVIAKHVAKNLITYIDNTFTNPSSPKITFLIGHDSNVASMTSALGIKPYHLANQFEVAPIGGKILFERWKDNKTGEQLMKIEYVYQSTAQIADMQPLNRANPAQHVTLEMKDCPTNAQGFCSYNQFIQALDTIVQ